MCYASSSGALSRLSILWGLLSLATLLTAFVSNVWLFTREPVRLPNSEVSTTITFKIGLWRVCPTVKKANISQPLPSPACSLIKYSTWDEVKHSDLGVWTPLDFTPAFITRMRLSTPFEAVSVFLMLLATMFAVIGHCNGDHKTLVACGLFILGGLSLGGGLVIFASVLSDAYMDRPRRHPYPNNPFDYRYGWSFFAAGAAFIMAELAALLSITAYLRRFPTLEDMVRVMVPGAERRLLRHQPPTGDYLVRQYRRRPPGPWADNMDYYSTKSETLVASDLEGVEGPLLLNNTAPDICSANPAAQVDDTPASPLGVIISQPTDTLLEQQQQQHMPTAADSNPAVAATTTTTTQDYDIPLSGVTTVPITLMRQQPLKPQHMAQETTPFLFAQRFGTGTLVHQGVLGVSEGASSSSSSSGTTTGSCHSAPTKYATLQPPHKKKTVTISTFSTMEHYDTSKSATWSNSEV